MEQEFQELAKEFSEEALKAAHDSTLEVLSQRARELEQYLRSTTPVRTGALLGSLVRVMVEDNEDRIVIRVAFDGYNSKGVAFQTIANALNKGYFNSNSVLITKHMHFIDNGLSILRNMDSEIARKFEIRLGGTASV